MSAYMIFTRDKTFDQGELEVYGKTVVPTMAGHPGKVLALYGAHQDLEGAPTEGTVILEFPTSADALGWYNSPEYKAVREHRFKGGAYRVMLIEGV